MREFLTKKQFGDAKRIFSIYSAKCKEKGEEPLCYGTIRAMLNGSRTPCEEVKEVAQAYFEKQDELQII